MNKERHRFSKRTGWDLGASSLSTSIAMARVAGRELIDLTMSNPTCCGFDYDAMAVLGPLCAEDTGHKALVYDPDPQGLRSARQAIVRYYEDHGASLDADALVLTTSTSEAYSYLFRLLCDAGDEVMVAQPSYPLFEFLADLDDVLLKPYPLFYDYGWWIDFAELERRIGPRTRAILVVHPNNPTGHWTHEAERERLEALCEARGLALVVDEVFLDYPIASTERNPARSFATGPHPVLTFVLSGISKVCALPQMKVAWIAAFGPASAAAEALARLEVIADTFLSMNAPAQLALPAWLEGRATLQQQIRLRTQSNLKLLQNFGMDVLVPEAGWSALVRLRKILGISGSSLASWLLDEAGVIVHPGNFYGISDERIFVLSLISLEATFHEGVEAISLAQGKVNLLGYPI